MKIMILGLGVIGTTYGYVFQKSGHQVEHFIRESKRDSASKLIDIKIFDGRYNSKGESKKDEYKDNLLDCVLFDHIMLESEAKAGIDNYLVLGQLIDSADIKVEVPLDMIE